MEDLLCILITNDSLTLNNSNILSVVRKKTSEKLVMSCIFFLLKANDNCGPIDFVLSVAQFCVFQKHFQISKFGKEVIISMKLLLKRENIFNCSVFFIQTKLTLE